MPLRKAPGTVVHYYLMVYDDEGIERPEHDESYLSETILSRLAAGNEPVSDIFLTSHGWKGDVPSAIEQYDAWIGAMTACKLDLDTASKRPGFTPLVVGIHWPSLPWGDENLPNAVPAAKGGPGLLSPSASPAITTDRVDTFASRIANTAAAREAIRTILEAGNSARSANPLPAGVRDAYATLFKESGLHTGGALAAPGADQEMFDPDTIIKQAMNKAFPQAGPAVLGTEIFSSVRDIVLTPLRQLSFWKMKDRARIIGEGPVHNLLRKILAAAPQARIHFMGHSFGCIVASASLAGPEAAAPIPRPINTLFLVQGALSIWAYSATNPFQPNKTGYFLPILANNLIAGPIVTTRSVHDKAVGRYYPLGAGAAGQLTLGNDYPPFGGIGAFGIQGVETAKNMEMLSATGSYGFQAGGLYNLEASNVIKKQDGASGAHSDIAHLEVAHAFWEAANIDESTRGSKPRGTRV